MIHSARAKKVLEEPRSFRHHKLEGMRKYPGGGLDLWGLVEWEGEKVRNTFFYSDEISEEFKVLLESFATLMVGRSKNKLPELLLRECEAYLRDKNSQPALDELPPNQEEQLRRIFQWVITLAPSATSSFYAFSEAKGPFRSLKLVDKVRELKAFFASTQVQSLYLHLPTPELVDVEDLSVFVSATYETEDEKSLFEKLHFLCVEIFKEESLNLIPES